MSKASRQREKIRDSKKLQAPKFKFSDRENTTSSPSPEMLSLMMMGGVFQQELMQKGSDR